LQKSKEILRTDPDFLPAWLVVVRQLREDGKLDECEELLERLLETHPDDAGLVAALGDLTADRGKLETALEYFVQALRLRPNDSEILLGTSVVLAKLGEVDRAILLAQHTLQMGGRVLPPGAVERLKELERLTE
jgi:Flp pilus assembly protein TadD